MSGRACTHARLYPSSSRVCACWGGGQVRTSSGSARRLILHSHGSSCSSSSRNALSPARTHPCMHAPAHAHMPQAATLPAPMAASDLLLFFKFYTPDVRVHYSGQRYSGRRYMGQHHSGQHHVGRHYVGRHYLRQHYSGQHHIGRHYLGRHYLRQHYSGQHDLGQHCLGRHYSGQHYLA